MTKKKTSRSASKVTKPKTKARSASKAKRSAKKKKPKTTVRQGKSPKAEETSVTIDRRCAADRRSGEPDAFSAQAETQKLERRKKVNRRRQIDPTTCERDYTDAEIEFMNAFDEYKRKNGRMFPTCSEVLEVIRSLGYVQLTTSEIASRQTNQPADAPTDVEKDDAESTPSFEEEAERVLAEMVV